MSAPFFAPADQGTPVSPIGKTHNPADLLAGLQWCIGKMQGDSGTGESYWEQFPEYRAARAAMEAATRATKASHMAARSQIAAEILALSVPDDARAAHVFFIGWISASARLGDLGVNAAAEVLQGLKIAHANADKKEGL